MPLNARGSRYNPAPLCLRDKKGLLLKSRKTEAGAATIID
jgi:hypothetical protein